MTRLTKPENQGFTADSPFREIEPGKDLNKAAMYKMMTWGITPRPVAFVSTMGKDGSTNVSTDKPEGILVGQGLNPNPEIF